MAVRLPQTACIYKKMYGWVDRTNQVLAYYNSDRRTVRKQNRVLESLIEAYALNNGHCVWQNSPNLIANVSRDDRSISEFRFKVVRAWYARCQMYNSKTELLQQPNQPTNWRRKVEHVLLSPRRGRHNQIRLTSLDASGKECRLKCHMCGKKTTQKCEKCSRLGDPVALCDSKISDRQCWNTFHGSREHDNLNSESSQSQEG